MIKFLKRLLSFEMKDDNENKPLKPDSGFKERLNGDKDLIEYLYEKLCLQYKDAWEKLNRPGYEYPGNDVKKGCFSIEAGLGEFNDDHEFSDESLEKLCLFLRKYFEGDLKIMDDEYGYIAGTFHEYLKDLCLYKDSKIIRESIKNKITKPYHS